MIIFVAVAIVIEIKMEFHGDTFQYGPSVFAHPWAYKIWLIKFKQNYYRFD